MVYHGHGGFVIGSEMSCGVHNVLVENCTFIGTDVGLRFKSCLGRGGTVRDIWIRNIRMDNIKEQAVVMNMGYSSAIGSERDVEKRYPEEDIRNSDRSICRRYPLHRRQKSGGHLRIGAAPHPRYYSERSSIHAQQGVQCRYARTFDSRDVTITSSKILPRY